MIDPDVLIDVALDRAAHAGPACRLLDHLQAHPGDGMIAWHTVSNFYYMVRPNEGDSGARDFIADLLRFLDITAGDTSAVRAALQLPMADFEDALQVAAAQTGRADFIVTRNTTDYRRSPVPARTPSEILADVGGCFPERHSTTEI